MKALCFVISDKSFHPKTIIVKFHKILAKLHFRKLFKEIVDDEWCIDRFRLDIFILHSMYRH